MSVTVQSTYSKTITAAVNGAPATMSGWDADSKIAEEALTFGLAVSQGTADSGVIKGGTHFVGCVLRDVTLPPSQEDAFLEGQNVSVLSRGDIWVTVEDAVVAGAVVLYNATTGQLGSDGGSEIANSRWMTSAGIGGLAIARLGSAAGGVV
jgi:hypothetical protein